MNENKKCLKSSHSANFGGGNSLRLRNEDLENFEKITTQSKVEDVVKNTSPLAGEVEFVNTNSGEGLIEGLTIMRSLRRFAPQDDMSEVESNKNLSLALGERVSAGQERGQLQDMTEITLTRKSSFRETLKQIFNPLPEVEGKCAFTLAEVLITLGIIGIVAALTLPAFISNVQGRIQAKRVENINQKLSKVTDKMAVQSGLTGYDTTMAFVQEMSKYMKIAKICDNEHLAECWPTQEVTLNDEGKTWEISKTKNAKTLKILNNAEDWADTVGIVTGDGTGMILSYNKKCEFNVDDKGLKYDNSTGKSNSLVCLSGVYDWNGSSKPNKLGKDVTMLAPATGLGNNCAIKAGGKCFTAAFFPTSLTKAQCEAEKDKLGIKGCCPDDSCHGNDRWAGAVKQCGGVSKMPTQADLTELAKVLYNEPNLGSPGHQFGRLDTSKASSMGFTGDEFYVWSGEEDTSDPVPELVYMRYFYRYGISAMNVYKTPRYSNIQAVCLGD